MARPMPFEPPVTTATRSERSRSMSEQRPGRAERESARQRPALGEQLKASSTRPPASGARRPRPPRRCPARSCACASAGDQRHLGGDERGLRDAVRGAAPGWARGEDVRAAAAGRGIEVDRLEMAPSTCSRSPIVTGANSDGTAHEARTASRTPRSALRRPEEDAGAAGALDGRHAQAAVEARVERVDVAAERAERARWPRRRGEDGGRASRPAARGGERERGERADDDASGARRRRARPNAARVPRRVQGAGGAIAGSSSRPETSVAATIDPADVPRMYSQPGSRADPAQQPTHPRLAQRPPAPRTRVSGGSVIMLPPATCRRRRASRTSRTSAAGCGRRHYRLVRREFASALRHERVHRGRRGAADRGARRDRRGRGPPRGALRRDRRPRPLPDRWHRARRPAGTLVFIPDPTSRRTRRRWSRDDRCRGRRRARSRLIRCRRGSPVRREGVADAGDPGAGADLMQEALAAHPGTRTSSTTRPLRGARAAATTRSPTCARRSRLRRRCASGPPATATSTRSGTTPSSPDLEQARRRRRTAALRAAGSAGPRGWCRIWVA